MLAAPLWRRCRGAARLYDWCSCVAVGVAVKAELQASMTSELCHASRCLVNTSM